MVRFASILAAAGAAVAMPCGSAWAASDITIAAIATGRLYVVGTTERPHTAVTLDDQFRTESDDAGKFQYELIYHPARCIVSATIDGKAYEAVVTNCSQQCQVVPPSTAAALPVTATAAQPAGTPPGPGPAAPTTVSRPAAPVRTGAVPPQAPVKQKLPPKPSGTPPSAARPDAAAAQRAAHHAAASAKPAQPPRPIRKPRPPVDQPPERSEPPIAD